MGDTPTGWELKDFKSIVIPPEHKGSLGDTFNYIDDKMLEEERFHKSLENEKEKERKDIMDERLKELKTLYKEMASNNPEDRRITEHAKQVQERIQQREEDLTTPHTCDAAYIYYPAGASLDEIEPFTTELTEVVDKMKEELLNEKRVLEGTEIDEYKENEFSQPMLIEEQWKMLSQNGYSTTDLIPISITELNNSSSFVDLFTRSCPIVRSDDELSQSSTNSCSGKLEDFGDEIDVMNEFSECTVPMINEQMDGTL